MEEKKQIKVSFYQQIFLVIALALIIIMGVFWYMQKTEADSKIAELENSASELQEIINNLQEKIDSENTSNINKTPFMVIAVANEMADEVAYKYKIITDEKETSNLRNIINSATKYEANTFFTLEECPVAEVYDENGKKYTIVAKDQLDDDGNIVNVFTKFEKEDESDKKLYKVDVKLEEYINNLYNTSEDSTSISD